jgi:hypothetical protein
VRYHLSEDIGLAVPPGEYELVLTVKSTPAPPAVHATVAVTP